MLKLLTWNLWSASSGLEARARALVRTVERLSPDLVAFQEVTPAWLEHLAARSWLDAWHGCGAPSGRERFSSLLLSRTPFVLAERRRFSNSRMGRELVLARLAHPWPVTVATTHLESLAPGHPLRWAQLEEAISELDAAPAAVLLGDLNWISGLDPELTLPDGWVDAWPATGRAHSEGLTYDARANPHVTRHRQRLDRILCKLPPPLSVREVELVGTNPAEGEPFVSDHFGLFCRLG